MLQYDDIKHRYWDEKGDLPGISRILEPINDIDSIPKDVLENAANRGTKIHKLAEKYDIGIITKEDLLKSEYQSYMEQYLQFLKDTKVEWWAIERKLMHPELRFAGRLDRIGFINGKTYLVDIKTASSSQDWWKVQLEAQRILASQIIKIDCVRSLHLNTNGKYKLIKYKEEEEAEAREVFLGLLKVCHWGLKHGKRSY